MRDLKAGGEGRREFLRNTFLSLAGWLAPKTKASGAVGAQEPAGFGDRKSNQYQRSSIIESARGRRFQVVTLSDDGRLVCASEFESDHFTLHDAGTGRELRVFAEEPGPIQQLCFQADGRLVVSAAPGGFVEQPDTPRIGLRSRRFLDPLIKTWDVDTGRVGLVLHGSVGEVVGLAISRDGETIASLDSTFTFRRWSARTGGILFELKGPEVISRARSPLLQVVAFSADVRRCAAIHVGMVIGDDSDMSKKRSVGLWDSVTKTHRFASGHSGLPMAIALSPDGERVLVGGTYHELSTLDFVTGNCLRSVAPGDFRPTPGLLKFEPNGSFAAACTALGHLRLDPPVFLSREEAVNFPRLAASKIPPGEVRDLVFLPERIRVATGGWKGEQHVDRPDGSQFMKHEPITIWDVNFLK